jgi:hypothetical protein
MLYPLVNALPSGWTAFDGGSCGSTGASLSLTIVSSFSTPPVALISTTVEVLAASGGTGGTYTAIQNFTFIGEQGFSTLVSNLPTGSGLKVQLSSSLIPGDALVSESISLATNGVTGATASMTGGYLPISAIFPAVISASNTYTANVNITY